MGRLVYISSPHGSKKRVILHDPVNYVTLITAKAVLEEDAQPLVVDGGTEIQIASSLSSDISSLEQTQAFADALLRAYYSLEGEVPDGATAEVVSDVDGGEAPVIRFTFPTTSLVLPSSEISPATSFTANEGIYDVSAPNTVASRLPPDAKSLFDRVEVSIGGVHLTQGSNYVNILTFVRNAALGKRGDILMAHGEMVRKNGYTESGAVGLFENTPVVASGFVGFLDSDTILDTALCGDMVVTLHTAGNEIISCSGDPGSVGAMTSDIDGSTGSYLINDLFASIEVMQMGDSTLSEMNRRIIAEKGFLEIPFKNYISSIMSHGGTSRFTVATQSLDRVWVMLRRNSDIGPGKSAHGVLGTSAGSVSVDPNIQLSGEEYLPSVFTSSIPSTDATYQLSLNGALYPQFQASPHEWAEITRNSVSDLTQEPLKYITRPCYRSQKFYLCARLNLPGSEKSRTISGLDTRGVSISGQFISHNDGTNTHQSLIFSECTSSLRIKAGRTVEVVH